MLLIYLGILRACLRAWNRKVLASCRDIPSGDRMESGNKKMFSLKNQKVMPLYAGAYNGSVMGRH